jgi:hypothetical protein
MRKVGGYRRKSTTILVFGLKIRPPTLLYLFYQSVEFTAMGDRHSSHSSRSKRPRCASISVDNCPVDHDIEHPVDHHVGSLDEDPAAAFSNVSAAHEKVVQVAKLLKEWHWSFSTLVKQWLTFKDVQQGMRSARKRTDLLRTLLIEDAETTYRELKKHSLLVESMELAEMNLLRCEILTA